jgi:hypothetical protein
VYIVDNTIILDQVIVIEVITKMGRSCFMGTSGISRSGAAVNISLRWFSF